MLGEEFVQSVGNLSGDVSRDFLDVRIALQVASRYVKRNIRRVDHTVQQRQELRYDALDRVGDEDLIAIELYLVLLYFEVVPNLREVEDTGQIERVVDVEVDVEERIFGHRVEGAVKLHVLFVGEVGRFLCPQRLCGIDDIILIGVDVFTVFPLLFLAEGDRNGQETAIFVKDRSDPRFVGKLFGIFAQMEDDVCTAFTFSCGLFHRVFGRSVTRPMHRLRPFTVGTGYDLHFVRNHES